jgi:large subunit ribosomal protein L4
MALSDKLQSEKLLVLNGLDLEEIKTKSVVEILRTLNIQKTLIIAPEMNEKLVLSSRNIQGVKVLPPEGLNVYDLLKFENLVLFEHAVEKIEGRLR